MIPPSFPEANDYEKFCKEQHLMEKQRREHPLYPEYSNYIDSYYAYDNVKIISIFKNVQLIISRNKNPNELLSFKNFLEKKKATLKCKYYLVGFLAIALATIGFVGLFYLKLNLWY